MFNNESIRPNTAPSEKRETSTFLPPIQQAEVGSYRSTKETSAKKAASDTSLPAIKNLSSQTQIQDTQLTANNAALFHAKLQETSGNHQHHEEPSEIQSKSPEISENHRQKIQDFLKTKFSSVLVVAEDSPTVIKILRKQLIQIAKMSYVAVLTTSLDFDKTMQWEDQGITWDIIGTHAIIYAANGAIAFRIMQLLPPEITTVLFTDQNMPKMTGTELCDASMKLKNNNPVAIAIHSDLAGETADGSKILECLKKLKKLDELNEFNELVKQGNYRFIPKRNLVEIESFIVESNCYANETTPALAPTKESAEEAPTETIGMKKH